MNCGKAERDEPEREDADRVGDGHGQPEEDRVPRRSPRSDEIGGDDRLAVPRRERVRRAPEHRDQQREQHEPGAELLVSDQAREAAVRDAVGRLERTAASQPRRRVARRRDRCRHRRDVQRAREQILRVRAQLVAAALRVRADDDLPPAQTAGVVRVAVGDPARPRDPRSTEDDLEPRRAEPAGTSGNASAWAVGTSRVRVAVDAQVCRRRRFASRRPPRRSRLPASPGRSGSRRGRGRSARRRGVPRPRRG